MQENSFHRLLDEEMNEVPPLPPEVRQKVQGSMTFLQLVGKTLELYVPQALDTLLFALGSTEPEPGPPPSSSPSESDPAASLDA
jgi:hypothetical protein